MAITMIEWGTKIIKFLGFRMLPDLGIKNS